MVRTLIYQVFSCTNITHAGVELHEVHHCYHTMQSILKFVFNGL